MQIKLKQRIPVVFLSSLLLLICIGFVSCKDDYIYDNKEPDFLGASIYDFMEKDGNFTYYLKLIDDLGYKEVLSRTGSKTLFPARDDAFERFFQNNEYGVKSYEDLKPGLKRNIMNISMINMTYLSHMLSNTSGNQENPKGEGLAVKKTTANTFLDTIPFVRDEKLFEASPYWDYYKSTGLYLIENESASPVVLFTEKNMFTRGITTDDFSTFTNGLTYNTDDIYVNGVKVIEKDIICKNGYIHVLEEVMLPSKNMAEVIRDNGETDLFNELMNKFCLPYFNEDISRQVHEYYTGATPDRELITDSVFVKRYFTDDFDTDPNNNSLVNYGLLYFDPANKGYGGEEDMGVMFVPTDKTLQDYINSERGRYLREAYGTWENVPTSLLALFIKNHQKKSFLSALPHMWANMDDESSFPMNVSEANVKKSYIASNGIVYVTDEVYPPIDYQSVYAPTMINPETKIMNWGIKNNVLKFSLYLRSMENLYNLLVPMDEAFSNYRDPLAWAIGTEAAREIWEFRYVEQMDMVFADVYSVGTNGEKDLLLRTIGETDTEQGIIRNRLNDIIDMHIIVADNYGYIDAGNIHYVKTKSGTTLKIAGSGNNTTITGGGDIEMGLNPAEIVVNPTTGGKYIYESDNGKTFFLDKIVNDPLKSVYTIMGEHPEYEYFFNLLRGNDQVLNFFQSDKDVSPVFDTKRTTSTSGIGFVVNSFNNFRYTVLVPTQEALEKAFAEDKNLFTWEELAEIEDYDEKKEKTLYLLEFLKYHFIDNSFYIDGTSYSGNYETAARNELNKFRKVTVSSNGNNLQVRGVNPAYTGNVIKTDGLYNVMSRDYIVNNADPTRATLIESSSRAVIHLVDNVVRYE